MKKTHVLTFFRRPHAEFYSASTIEGLPPGRYSPSPSMAMGGSPRGDDSNSGFNDSGPISLQVTDQHNIGNYPRIKVLPNFQSCMKIKSELLWV